MERRREPRRICIRNKGRTKRTSRAKRSTKRGHDRQQRTQEQLGTKLYDSCRRKLLEVKNRVDTSIHSLCQREVTALLLSLLVGLGSHSSPMTSVAVCLSSCVFSTSDSMRCRTTHRLLADQQQTVVACVATAVYVRLSQDGG